MFGARRYPLRYHSCTTAATLLSFIAFIFMYSKLAYFDQSRPYNRGSMLRRPSFHTATKSTNPWINFYFEQLQSPSPGPNALKYSPYGSMDFFLPEELSWHVALGRDLCIIDLDDRPFNESGQIFGPHMMTWHHPDSVHGLSLGILNHFLYSKMHGYKYYYIAVDSYTDRRTSWKKPSIISKILQHHQVCIYIDSDALFRHLELPFEWLMNYWHINPASNSLALASDPAHEANQDEFGEQYLNTGFLVAQHNDKTFEILNAWEECPDDGGRYPECAKFRTNDPGRPTDQGGFGTFVRYDYADYIKELPCDEANGFAEAHADCDGTFIQHVWSGKNSFLKIFAGSQMPGPYLEYFHKEFVATMADFYVTEADLRK